MPLSEQETFHILVVVVTRKDNHRIEGGGGQLMDPINAIVRMNPSDTIVHTDPAWMMK